MENTIDVSFPYVSWITVAQNNSIYQLCPRFHLFYPSEESPAARRTRRFSGAVLGDSAEVATPTRRSRRRSGLEPETISSSGMG